MDPTKTPTDAVSPKLLTPPKKIDGVRVERSMSEPMEVRGALWQTMRAVDSRNESIWEFDLRSGRILHMFDARGNRVSK